MNKIDFPRQGYDGIWRSQFQIEKWFKKEVESIIGRKLQVLYGKLTDVTEQTIVNNLLLELHKILFSQPADLKAIKDYYLNSYSSQFSSRAKGSFNKKVLAAFNYTEFRKTVLPTLAKYLNIKSCPYCNAQYTLYLDVRNLTTYPKGVTKFQFDHFYGQGEAPFLSMSLYNLIPSCASCNLIKKEKSLPLELNPYVGDIQSMFKFRLSKPYLIWTGAKMYDTMGVKMMPTKKSYAPLVKELDKRLMLSKHYGRHWDVAQDIFEKVYIYPYYSRLGNFDHMLTHLNEERLKQLWLGTFTKPDEIEKRPLTKFDQDMWEQADEIMASML